MHLNNLLQDAFHILRYLKQDPTLGLFMYNSEDYTKLEPSVILIGQYTLILESLLRAILCYLEIVSIARIRRSKRPSLYPL